jgi:4,5-DOPA dioxygenase extradiol
MNALPALYLSHGAPPLLDDALWMGQLNAWSTELPKPSSVLMVSAHWESQPASLSSTEPLTPLVYDFYGFPQRFYDLTYEAPTAPGLAARVKGLLDGANIPVATTDRGLDHGAYVPLMAMFPDADVPVQQLSLPTLNPSELLRFGEALRPLRDEGVLVVGSGFMTHGLPFLRMESPTQAPPSWSSEFDGWAKEAIESGDLDALLDFENKAPAVRFAHPRTEHFAPLFVALGAAGGLTASRSEIEGFWFGLSKRSYAFT